jgi:hypothetical protein
VKADARAKTIAIAEYKKSIGKQLSLLTDKDVRRDYFKSQQWVEQHVKIKVHITGYASCYESIGSPPQRDPRPNDSRPQGSLYSQQKHAIADAIEWIRRNSKYKPRIFVATTPGFVDLPEGKLIAKLTNNLRMSYGMQEYVWVRELTKKGYPHYHFVADMPEFQPNKLSIYWSSLFGVDPDQGKYSIRLGTRPDPVTGKRKYWITNSRMAWYMSKYIGKNLGEPGTRKKYRTFGISETARQESQPMLYSSFISKDFSNRTNRAFVLDDEQLSDLIDKAGPNAELPVQTIVNPYDFDWKWTGHGQTFSGFRRDSEKNLSKKRNFTVKPKNT